MFYLPEDRRRRCPCVVMAHGFSGTMDWILPDFAECFAQGGLAVLTFDYRYLGKAGDSCDSGSTAVASATICGERSNTRVSKPKTTRGGWPYGVRRSVEFVSSS